jgi:predicted alpha/beta superfamily hydrolase
MPFQLLVVALLSLCTLARAETQAKPYVLEGTQVQSIRSEMLSRDYELYVDLPASYGQSHKSYPVVFITDAPYAFPLVRSISRRVSDHGKALEEFILVGLSYANGDSPAQSRNRDYTPTDVNAKKTREVDQGAGPYGGAESYRRFVANEVLPFVARRYRADMNRKIYIGHSYGALFGIHALLTEPTMFNAYVLGSPSLWYDKRTMFDAERAYAATNKDLPAQVLLMVGSFESIPRKSSNPRFNKRIDMVKDAHAFEKQLKSRNYRGLSIRSEVIDDEDHLTVFPAIATRGLLWTLSAQ